MLSELKAELRDAVDTVFAEPLRHLPMDRGAPDQDRTPTEFSAPLRTGDRQAKDPEFGRGTRDGAGLAAGGATVRIDRLVHPNLIPRR